MPAERTDGPYVVHTVLPGPHSFSLYEVGILPRKRGDLNLTIDDSVSEESRV